MGLPKKPPEEKHSVRRSIALKPSTAAALERAAALTEIGVDTLIRMAVVEKLHRDGWLKSPGNGT